MQRERKTATEFCQADRTGRKKVDEKQRELVKGSRSIRKIKKIYFRFKKKQKSVRRQGQKRKHTGVRNQVSRWNLEIM